MKIYVNNNGFIEVLLSKFISKKHRTLDSNSLNLTSKIHSKYLLKQLNKVNNNKDPMISNFLNPFKPNSPSNTEVAKPLVQKIYKSFIVLYTSPISKGMKVGIDKYGGMVQNIDLWYCKLSSKGEFIYIPTSFIYDKVIRVNK